MKFLQENKINMTSEILKLRYGVTNPMKGQVAKFSRTEVAKFMK